MMAEDRRSMIRGALDLDDETSVQDALERASPEQAEDIRRAALARPVGKATLRLLTIPRRLEAGDPNPETGEPLAEPGAGLETGVIYQWETTEVPWAPAGSEIRKELSAMVPYLQAMLGLQLLANSHAVLAERLTEEQKGEMKTFLESANRLIVAQGILYQPVFEMLMNWYCERSGAQAQAEALIQGAN